MLSLENYLVTQLHQYPGSTYLSTSTQKPTIAFYYDDLKGRRIGRKTRSAPTKDQLLQKRIAFLTGEYNKMVAELNQVPSQSIYKPNEVSCTMPEMPAYQPINKKDGLLSDTIASFLDSKRNTSYGNQKSYRYYGNHLLNYFGKDRLWSAVTHKELNNFLYWLMSRKNPPYSESYMKEMIRFIKSLAFYAKRHKSLDSDDYEDLVSDLIIPSNAVKYDPNKVFLNYSELGNTLARIHQISTKNVKNNGSNKSSDGLIYYLVAMIIVLTGLRTQEVFALKKEDLHREENYIRVERALNLVGKDDSASYEIGTTKTTGSVRDVPAIDAVFDYFDELEHLMKRTGSRKKSIENGNGDMLFVNRDGNIMNLTTFGRRFKIYMKARITDKDRLFKMYDMRHEFKNFVEMEGPAGIYTDVEAAMGHKPHDVGSSYYRSLNARTHIKNLLPIIEVVHKNIDAAFNDSLNRMGIQKKIA